VDKAEWRIVPSRLACDVDLDRLDMFGNVGVVKGDVLRMTDEWWFRWIDRGYMEGGNSASAA
jgi:hypothetical protein